MPEYQTLLFPQMGISWPNRRLSGIGLTSPPRPWAAEFCRCPLLPTAQTSRRVHFKRNVIQRHGVAEMQADIFKTNDGGIPWCHCFTKTDSTRKDEGGQHKDPDRGADHGAGGGATHALVPPLVRIP